MTTGVSLFRLILGSSSRVTCIHHLSNDASFTKRGDRANEWSEPFILLPGSWYSISKQSFRLDSSKSCNYKYLHRCRGLVEQLRGAKFGSPGFAKSLAATISSPSKNSSASAKSAFSICVAAEGCAFYCANLLVNVHEEGGPHCHERGPCQPLRPAPFGRCGNASMQTGPPNPCISLHPRLAVICSS
jgi:hypothetical protein